MEQAELFPAAVGGLVVRLNRDQAGRWTWRVVVALDTPLERCWGIPECGEAADKETAWMDASEQISAFLFGAEGWYGEGQD